jgi:ribulose-5-phosphate 4-epimerase/fuculose-1-phosphate aldolase
MKIAMKTAVKDDVRRPSSQDIREEEWQIRRDLAACYRLVALFGWDDLIATHLSAKIPGPEETFLINPIGHMFDEITASCLVKVNGAGEILQDTPHSINRAGFVIHSTVHEARPEAECVMHLHSRDGVAVSALEDGLLPLNQSAMVVAPHVAYHEYEGVAVNDEERARLAADLGDKRLMILRNHGTLSVAESVAEAFFQIYMLEWACTVQVRSLGMSQPLHAATQDSIVATGALMDAKEDAASFATNLVWPALLRKLDRVNPGYTQ